VSTTIPADGATSTKTVQEFIELKRTNSLSANGCVTTLTVTVKSNRFTSEELAGVLDSANRLGNTLVTNALHRELADVLSDEPAAEGGPVDIVEPYFIELTDNNGSVTVLVENEIERQVADAAQFYFYIDKLAATVVDAASSLLLQLKLKQLAQNQPSSKDYAERLVFDLETPTAEKIPPGLKPEHWREFVEYFEYACPCSRPGCPGGVMLGLERSCDELAIMGISEETARAVIDNASLNLLRKVSSGVADSLGMSLREYVESGAAMYAGPFGSPDEPLGDLGITSDMLANIGVPRPSAGSPLSALFGALGGRPRSRRRRESGEQPL
jgi:hypothetical protein